MNEKESEVDRLVAVARGFRPSRLREKPSGGRPANDGDGTVPAPDSTESPLPEPAFREEYRPIALVGPSGSGKTSLAAVLLGQVPPEEHTPTRSPVKVKVDTKKSLGMVPRDRYVWTTVAVVDDVPGSANLQDSVWRQEVKDSHVAIFVVDFSRLIRDHQYAALSMSAANRIFSWRETTPFGILLTHLDETPDVSAEAASRFAEVNRLRLALRSGSRLAACDLRAPDDARSAVTQLLHALEYVEAP
jgi:hypothetical protein